MKSKIFSALTGLALLVGTGSCSMSAAELHERELQKKVLSTYEQCFDGQYDNGTRCLEIDLEEAVKGVYPLSTALIQEIDGGGRILSYGGGTGILFEEGYLLTAYHVAHRERAADQQTLVYLNAPESRFFLEEVAGDKGKDFSLLKIVGMVPDIETYKSGIGNSDDLKMGNVTYLFGNAVGKGLALREGIVSRTDFNYAPPGYFYEDLGVSNGSVNGDSGGPVFALRDGNVELIGILVTGVRGARLDNLIGINTILEKLEELMPGEEIPIKRK